MAYTPTTWNTGDTITASALNKMEQGIADGGGYAIVNISASGFSSSSRLFAYVAYAVYKNNRWELINDVLDLTAEYTLAGYIKPTYRTLPPMFIPSEGDMYPFIIPAISMEVETTGGVSNDAEPVFYSYGSYNPGYRITGNGSITFIAV